MASEARRYFISGSDTGVGKTYVSAQLLKVWREGQKRCVGIKPIATGERGDAVVLMGAASMPGWSLDDVNPWFLTPPASPYTASIIEERMLDWDALDRAVERGSREAELVLIEGAGGIMTPVTRDEQMRELAQRWNCPVVLVVANRLGALTQALSAVECVRGVGLKLAAVVLNTLPADVTEEAAVLQHTNQMILEERLPGLVYKSSAEEIEKLAKKLASEVV